MPQLLDYPRYAWQLVRGDRSTGERNAFERRWRDISPYLDGQGSLRVLDLGNGRLRPQYALLRAAGHRVYGLDLINRPNRSWQNIAYAVARQVYTRRLGISSASAAPETLVCGDVGRLPFPDAFFDLAISMAAFEHFLDVPAVVGELSRVLRPGGIAWVCLHPFTSPSGGHNVSFTESPLRHIPPGVDPWDHLRRRRLPFTVPLNEWRWHQYVEEFGRHFDVLAHYCAGREGEHLLTPEIQAELPGYSRDELTCAALVIMVRKPARAA
jgi:SAM-dependent methyltransferase